MRVLSEYTEISRGGEIVKSIHEFILTPDFSIRFFKDELTKRIELRTGIISDLELQMTAEEFSSFLAKFRGTYRRIRDFGGSETFYDKLKLYKDERELIFLKGCDNVDCKGIRIQRHELMKLIRWKPALNAASTCQLTKL